MRDFWRGRWFWVVCLFAVINISGFLWLGYVLDDNESSLRVEAFRPRGVSSRWEEISIRFDQPMVQPGVQDASMAAGLVNFEPELKGHFSWKNSRQLVFWPNEPLPPCSNFQTTLSGELQSALGYRLGEERQFKFSTGRLRLRTAKQASFGPDGRLILALNFNEKVAPDQMLQHLTVRSDRGRKLSSRCITDEVSSRLLVETEKVESDYVEVHLEEGLKPARGHLGTVEERVHEVSLEPGIGIGEVKGYARSEGKVYLSVECTQDIDLDRASAFIEVSPTVDCTVTDTWRGMKLRGAFEPGEKYTVRFLKGLTAEGGQHLGREISRRVTVPDLPSNVDFSSSGIYLSPRGNRMVPLDVTNAETVHLRVWKVFANNVVHFMRDRDGRSGWPEELTTEVGSKEMDVDARRNERATINVDMSRFVDDNSSGVYMMRAQAEENRWRSDRRLVVMSDLGLSVKQSGDETLVWVTRLSTTEPVKGATVWLYSRSNQKMISGLTDERGLARMPHPADADGKTPFAVVASTDGDATVLKLEEGNVDLTSFDTGGRSYLSEGYEAFLYPDRTIYRPGETLHLHAIMRGVDTVMPGEFPVRFVVTRPDGRPFTETSAALSKRGSADVSIDLPDYAVTGRYSVEITLPEEDEALGRCGFQVEEFVPNRMEAEIDAPEGPWEGGQELTFTARARHLFGAPAGGRHVEARLRLVPETFDPDGWSDYTFSDSSRSFSPRDNKVGEGTLDEEGEKEFVVRLPDDLQPASALTARLTASVQEVGGRSVTSVADRACHAYPRYVGVQNPDDHVTPGTETVIRCALVGPDGQAASDGQLNVRIYRVHWHSVMKKTAQGGYRFISEKEEREVKEVTCSVKEGRGSVRFTPDEVGHYRLRAVDPEGGAAASISFYCSGSGAATWSMRKPRRLEMVTGKDVYRAGETARVMVKAPYAGRMLFTVEGDQIHEVRVVECTGNTTEVEVPVRKGYGPNVYCSATLLRPVRPEQEWSSHRAVGAVPLRVDRSGRRLEVSVNVPEKARSGAEVPVSIRIRDVAGEPVGAEVTLSAVDEGIHQLAPADVPDPWNYFYGKRTLGVETRDLYSLLMPEVYLSPVADSSPPGGDGRLSDPRIGNPIAADRVQCVSFWRGNLTTGKNGRVQTTLNLPRWTGRLHLEAVAAGQQRFGSVEADLTVDEPLTVRSSFPRFLAPGDRFTVPATIFNRTGTAGEARVMLRGMVGGKRVWEQTKQINLEEGEERTVRFEVKAPARTGRLDVSLTTQMGDEDTRRDREIAVRPPATLSRVSGSMKITDDDSATFELPGGWLTGTTDTRLVVSSRPTLDFGDGLQFLLRYPHGCSEQTVSRIFPLLYFDDVARMVDPEKFEESNVRHFVQAGVRRLLSMQTERGGFAWWPGYHSPYRWGSVYVTHFLVEARNAGYGVPPRRVEKALDYVASLQGTGEAREHLPEKAYAAYVLALSGKARESWCRRLYELREDMPVYSRFHLAGAMALMHEREGLDALIDLETLPSMNGERETGGRLDSPLRRAAILLSVYLNIAPDHTNVSPLVERVGRALKTRRRRTTQETAFALLAMGQYARHVSGRETDYAGKISIDDNTLASFTDEEGAVLQPDGAEAEKVTVSLDGKGQAYCYWTREGIPVDSTLPPVDRGMAVRRRYLSRDGEVVPLSEIEQGQVLIAEITVRARQPVENVVISDLLPAGLEIQNPALETRNSDIVDLPAPEVKSGGLDLFDVDAQNSSDSERAKELEPDNVQMRDDRLLVFTDLPDGEARYYRYVVRAVTPGEFVLPAISARCMYDPAYESRHGDGHVRIGREW